MTEETLFCVGGPFDDREVTTPKWCETLLRTSPTYPVAGCSSFIRSTYRRDPLGGYPAIWRFVSSETFGLVSEPN